AASGAGRRALLRRTRRRQSRVLGDARRAQSRGPEIPAAPEMTTGRLITLEGGEGAGKSTVLDAVRQRLEARGIDVVVTREPGGTVLGEAVRDIVLDPARRNISAESELLLMFAARAQLVRELIRPALDAGRWVLSDRFTDASYAYQGGGRGQPDARIAELEHWAAAGVTPDLTLLLDLAVA